ncbi:unnamed protein product [Cylicocyclus nassatus]|uniref:Uncharacterized protein n=1 Tax=Cylicocyclus nassatus TaxID=53992 RepID=A0AA36GSZ7_CYLNA|nr:unnamed protein product [Cylicocyclus nassatus]
MERLKIDYSMDVRAKVFRIESSSTKETYSKEIASWTVANKVELLYGNIDVDINTIKTYRIVTALQPPFVQLSGDPEKPYEGFCIDLIDMICEELNFTYTIYEVEDGLFGAIDQSGNWNGLIAALVSGSADIALASLSATPERELAVDFTLPYYRPVGTAILMKKQDVRYSMFEFTEVLEWQVWLSIAAAYLLASITLRLFDKFSPYSNTNKKEKKMQSSIDMGNRVFTLKECLWFCMTSLTSQGGGEVPKNISGRIVAATWWLFGFIIVSSYSANLGAFLTASRLEQSIKTLEDLAGQYKVKYAPIEGSSEEAYFRNMAELEERFYTIWRNMAMNESMSQQGRTPLPIWDYPVQDKYTKMWRFMQETEFPSNMDEAVDRVLTSEEGFAYLGDANEIRYSLLTNCQLQQVGTEFARSSYAIAVQSGHGLKDQINNAIRMLTGNGRLHLLEEKWWYKNSNKVVCPETSLENGMAIQNVGGVFIIILLAITLSAIAFTIEYTYYRRSNVIIAEHY